MIAITSNWTNDYGPQNVTRKRTHSFGVKDIARCALTETYPFIDKLLKNKLHQISH